VLVVEDEAMIAALIEGILDDAGCAVVGPVATVAGALDAIDSQTIDAALLDVSVNGAKAYPVADRLAARGIPLVFVSGFSKRDLPRGYRRYAYVSKPFEPQEILTQLELSRASAAQRSAVG
jgi:DNA-binding response OmpR family regulator